MSGFRVGKPVTITKQFEIGGESATLTFDVLPPNKKMADEIGKMRGNDKKLEEAMEKAFRPENIAGLVKGWGGLLDADNEPLVYSEENLQLVCDMYPTIHGGIIEALYEAVPRKKEEERKNSPTSPSGTTDQTAGLPDAETTAELPTSSDSESNDN